jgi:predicted ABC-type ATPase
MPILYVIAGPNGIGKTTSSYDLVPANIPIVNSDEIAKEARSAGIVSANTQEYSNQEANRLIKDQLEKRNSFAMETNLADDQTWKFLIETQKTGYDVHLIYLSTDKQEVLNSRIAERVILGDHYIRPDIVLQRYEASLSLLNHYFDKPVFLQLFDNTKSIELKAEVKQGEIVYLGEQLPEWITMNLGHHLKKELKQEAKQGRSFRELSTIDEVRKSYQQLKDKNEELKKVIKPNEPEIPKQALGLKQAQKDEQSEDQSQAHSHRQKPKM